MKKSLLFFGIFLAATNAFAQWNIVSQMSAARSSHLCIPLSNGKVLTAGGYIFPNNLATAEIYNIATDTWSATSNTMTMPHTYAAGVALANGKVLVIGGYTGTSDTTACDLYDPTANSWSAAGKLTTKRESHTATLLQNGKVLVTGGYNGTTNLTSCELYDPATNVWTAAGNLTTARSFHSAVLMADGKVLVTGGYNPNAGYQLSAAEIYNPATNAWSAAANMTNARDWQAASLLSNGKILVTGGEFFTGNTPFAYNGLTSAELYDPTTNTWSAAANIPTGICYHQQYTLSNGKVLLVAGLSNTNYSSSAFTYAAATSYLYNVATNTWAAAPMNIDGRYSMASGLMANGKVIVTGGLGESSVEIYSIPGTTDVNDLAKTPEVMLYPNPATENLFVRFDGKLESLHIFDLAGKTVNSAICETGSNGLVIHSKDLTAGNYSLNLLINGYFIIKTFSVVK